MKRSPVVLLLLAACASAPPVEPPKPEPTERDRRLADLEAESLKPAQFRALYELRDESTGEAQLFELAFRAPHTAKLVVPGSHHVLFVDGLLRFTTATYRYEVPYLDEFRRTQERYAEALKIAGEAGTPALAFDLGAWERVRSVKSLRTRLTYTTAPTRFLWLRTLRDPAYVWDGKLSFRADGDGIATSAVEIVLEEHGFLSKVRMIPPGSAGFVLELRSLSFDALPDEVFAPSVPEAPDQSSRALEKLRVTIADNLLRSMIESMVGQRAPIERVRELFVAFYRVDLVQTYDPKRAVELVREGQDKYVADAKKRGEDRQKLVERVRVQKATALGQVEDIEERLRASYRRSLSADLLKGMPRETADAMLEALDAGLAVVIEQDLRAHVRAIFDGHLAELEK